MCTAKLIFFRTFSDDYSLFVMCNIANINLFFKITAGIGATQYDEQFVVLFSLTMAQLKQVS